MQENRTELSVSTGVLEKMAQIAACEVEGVTFQKKRLISRAHSNQKAFLRA